MILVALMACQSGPGGNIGATAPDTATPDTATPDTPALPDLQLSPDFTEDLTLGYACEFTMAGPSDGALLIDEAGTLRLQLEQGFGLVVFVGLHLDAFFDADNCDDLATLNSAQSIRMAYTATEGAFTTTNGADGRSFQLEGIVLTPDPEYVPYVDYTVDDVDLYDPIVLPDLTLGVVPYGVTAMPIID